METDTVLQIPELGKLRPVNGDAANFSGRLVEEDGEIVLYAPASLDPEDHEEQRYRTGDVLPDRRRAFEAVLENSGELVTDPTVVRFLEQPVRRSLRRPKRLGDTICYRVHLPYSTAQQLRREAAHKGIPVSKHIREIIDARDRPVIVTPPYPSPEA